MIHNMCLYFIIEFITICIYYITLLNYGDILLFVYKVLLYILLCSLQEKKNTL